MDKFTHTGWGFAKKGTKLLRHYDTKVNLPLPTGEVDFVSERSEFTKSGEGSIFKMLNDTKKKCAFTLSEVLIVLAVLGVVAAMTIPDLIQDYQKKATVTALKKVYSNLNQVITASAADNGPASDYFSANSTVDANTTKKFFETYWLPYFRVQKISNNNAIGFYGTYTPYSNLSGENLNTYIFTSYVNKRVLFLDISGTIYYLLHFVPSSYMIWIFVDLNGVKGPNTFGKDVFFFVVELNNSVVNPVGYNYSKNIINNSCSSSGNGWYCAAKIKRDGWEIADDYPW